MNRALSLALFAAGCGEDLEVCAAGQISGTLKASGAGGGFGGSQFIHGGGGGGRRT